jgi:hypothetical protein
MTKFAIFAAAIVLGGCTTQIHPPTVGNEKSKARLGQYEAVSLSAIKVERMEGDSGDLAAVGHIERNLSTCMKGVFPSLREGQAGSAGLSIEPIITDLKKVNGSERFWLGAMAGSSAVLLKVRYTDKASNQIVAEPTFYAKASAMGGAWSIGGTDNAMLSRVVSEACNYAQENR